MFWKNWDAGQFGQHLIYVISIVRIIKSCLLENAGLVFFEQFLLGAAGEVGLLLVVDEVVGLDQLHQTLLLLGQSFLFCKFQEENVKWFFGLLKFALERGEPFFYLYALLIEHHEDLLQLASFVLVLLPRGKFLPDISVLSVDALDLPR